MSQSPYISVIATAYNRRQYLPDALRSLERQTLPKDKFEVIVVKNFEDQASDEIIRRNNWKDIVTDVVPLGGKIAIGLEEAKGDVITFLEDDDMYAPERLQRVYEAFLKVRNLAYFHNEQIIIDDEGNVANTMSPFPALRARVPGYVVLDSAVLSKVDPKIGTCYFHALSSRGAILGPGLDWNNSSIAVRRNLVDSKAMAPMSTGVDLMVFASALRSGLSMAFSGEALTYYRVHAGSFGSTAFSGAEVSGPRRRSLESLLRQVQVARWHSYVARLLPPECRCNPYDLSSLAVRLHLSIVPMPDLKWAQLSLSPSIAESLRYLSCQLRLASLSGAGGLVRTLELTARAFLPIVAARTGSTAIKRFLYRLGERMR